MCRMSGFVYEFNHRGKQFHLQWLYHAALSITYAQLGKTRNITPFHHLCQLCRSQHQCERGSKLHRTIQLLLSPVATLATEWNSTRSTWLKVDCCRNRQQIDDNVNSTSCRGRLCRQCVPGFTLLGVYLTCRFMSMTHWPEIGAETGTRKPVGLP